MQVAPHRPNKYVRKYPERITRALKLNYVFKKVRYAHAFTVTVPAVGSAYEYIVSANDCHSPDSNPASPHQPLGWDQYSAFYGEYLVVGSKATLRSTWSDTASGGACYISGGYVGPMDSAAGGFWTSPGNATENGASTKILAGYTSAAGVSHATTYSAKKYYGLQTQNLRSHNDIIALTSESPADKHRFAFRFESLDTAASAKINCMLEIEYNVCLFSTFRARAENT